jgi:exopolysaccharide biosynthesis polyprenyl glycosylphosphotransferase
VPFEVLPAQKTWARNYRARLLASDVTIVTATVVLAVIFRFGVTTDASVRLAGLPVDYWLVAGAIVITWLFVIGAYRTRDARVVGVGPAEYKRIVAASLLTFGLLAIVFLVFKVDVARGFFIVTFPLGLGSLTLSRWFWRQWLTRQRRFGHYLSSAIVVGKPSDVRYVIRQIRKKSGAAYDIVGVATKRTDESYVSVDGHSIPVVGGLNEVPAAVLQYAADVVIVAGAPKGGANYIRTLGWDLEGTHAELVLASGLTNIAGPRIHMRPVEGLPLMHVELPQFEGGKHVLKRAFDIAASGLGLLLLAPLLLVLAILVRKDSAGPVLFKQERVGRNGEMFRMLKFRSMVTTAEEDLEHLLDQNEVAGGVLFKLRHDPRVTDIGRTLRKYSLDELPQLWNVLVGDMSLVGPRPPLMREVEQYESHVRRRLFIKPGLTGMWQVNGRSNLSWEESVTLDLYYVENWSLTGDFVILWRTAKAMKNSTGAY